MAKCLRKVIRIRAEDSPNVRLAFAEERAGYTPTNRMVVPGVLSYKLYKNRRKTWDKQRQAIGLDAEFYKGEELSLYPTSWIAAATARARALGSPDSYRSLRKWLGIDPAEGGDSSCWSIVCNVGLLKQISIKTPDTTVVTNMTVAIMKEWGIKAKDVAIDRGGGGKEHADRLRELGYPIRTVAFGEAVSLEPKRGLNPIEKRLETREDAYAYFNRRAEMYGELAVAIDPTKGDGVFAIPETYEELLRQMALIPKRYDQEGRLKLPPKNRRKVGTDEDEIEECLLDILGCSPDELDSLVLANYARVSKANRTTIGGVNR